MSKKNNYKVYVHINKVNGKRYYGITKQEVEKRWANGKGYKGNEHFTNAINKYGWDNFEHIVIARGLTEEEAKWLEVELIREWNTTNREYGYNISLGGESNPMDSEEARKKVSEAKKVKQLGKNNPFYGKKHTEETRKKIGEVHRGKIVSEETRKKLSEAKKDKQLGKNNPNATRVYCVELDMYFDTINEASEFISRYRANISRVLGKNGTCGGYHWVYAEDVEK